MRNLLEALRPGGTRRRPADQAPDLAEANVRLAQQVRTLQLLRIEDRQQIQQVTAELGAEVAEHARTKQELAAALRANRQNDEADTVTLDATTLRDAAPADEFVEPMPPAPQYVPPVTARRVPAHVASPTHHAFGPLPETASA